MNIFVISIIVFCFKTTSCADLIDGVQKYCTTASCVHAAAAVLDKLNAEVDPCDDFYEYACGNFAEELGVPDEKTTIDTLNFISERVLEYILTLVDPVEAVEVKDNEPKPHILSKKFYRSCRNIGK